jgi:hypothetical protein
MKMIEVSEAALESIKRMAQEDAQDAARYRWLRDNSACQWDHPIVVSQSKGDWGMRYVGPLTSSSLDAAIDAAMQAKP